MITEEIKAKAKEFAQSVLQPQIDAIADAYLKGYEDAMKTLPHDNVIDKNDTFVDLMLDSGTMWSTTVHKLKNSEPKEMDYSSAVRFGIPDKEQFEELFMNCKTHFKHYYEKNGKAVMMYPINETFYVWVKSTVSNFEAFAYKIVSGEEPTLVKRSIHLPAFFFRAKNKYDIDPTLD